LRFYQQLLSVPLYVSYFFRVVDRHSLQAPYIFNFYSKLIDGLKCQKAFSDIEVLRKALRQDIRTISGTDFGAGSRVFNYGGDRTIASIARHGVSSLKDCLLLSQLVKMSQPTTCIELGAALGLTTAYLSRAMPDGLIHSFEGNQGICKIAAENWNKLGCKNISLVSGNIDVQLPKLLHQVKGVDFVIIDANHTAAALLRYFQWIRSHVSQGAVVYVDDIRWSLEMYEAWQQLITHSDVTLSIELLNSGLLIFEKVLPKQHYILSY
jgi:predicted O-methyltransferase YrrM